MPDTGLTEAFTHLEEAIREVSVDILLLKMEGAITDPHRLAVLAANCRRLADTLHHQANFFDLIVG